MIDVQKIATIYDLPQDATYYISFNPDLAEAIKEYKARYFTYPDYVFAIKHTFSPFFFQVEKWDDKHAPLCPRCGGRLFYDGYVTTIDGAGEGERWRCEHCDYSIDIVES